jgi:hypothetical protein
VNRKAVLAALAVQKMDVPFELQCIDTSTRDRSRKDACASTRKAIIPRTARMNRRDGVNDCPACNFLIHRHFLSVEL